ncbi:MAG: DUF1475 family protein [Gammaproteobacteria bacterium]|nr:DUF1475 family protein [Gammaproteobacteria bacterium]
MGSPRARILVGAVAAAGLAVLLVAIAHALASGEFLRDGAELVANPWGLATLVDVYVGLTLFAALVFWREREPVVALLWLVLFYSLGNVATTVYVLLALRAGQGPGAAAPSHGDGKG